MRHVDLILLHPPITYRFRELSILHGPSNVAVPSSPIFENYPIGFLTLSEYLDRQGISVSVVNLAVKMLLNVHLTRTHSLHGSSLLPSALTFTGSPMWTGA